MSSSSNVVHLRQNYQIKVVLNNISPPIWRRLIVDSRITLDDLHDAIQVSMGWEDSHLHQFIDREKRIYAFQNDDEDDFMLDFSDTESIDESLVLISEVLKEEKDWIKYEYDFGDGWEHKIILEKKVPHKKDQLSVSCIKGKRSCPPEDCGGPWGYQELLEQLSAEDPDEELLEWLGEDFDAEHFSLKEVNNVLKEIFEEVVFNGKSGLADELKRINSVAIAPDEELLNDPDVPEEIKELVGAMQEAVGMVAYMDELLEQSNEAFEEIVRLSKDKKITAIAKKMLKAFNES